MEIRRVHEAKWWKGTLHYIHAMRKQYFGLLFFFSSLKGRKATGEHRGARSNEGVRQDKNEHIPGNTESRAGLITQRRWCFLVANYLPSAYLYCTDSPNRLYSWVSDDPSSTSSSRREYFGNDRIAVMKPAPWDTHAHHTRTHARTYGETSKTSTRIWTFTHVRVRRDLSASERFGCFFTYSGQLFRRLTSI